MPQLVDVQNMCRWINHHGVEKLIAGIQSYIEEDFVRWESFDKIPRVASHTPIGVIELMPTSDSNEYAFKYVNGHPKNTLAGMRPDDVAEHSTEQIDLFAQGRRNTRPFGFNCKIVPLAHRSSEKGEQTVYKPSCVARSIIFFAARSNEGSGFWSGLPSGPYSINRGIKAVLNPTA